MNDNNIGKNKIDFSLSKLLLASVMLIVLVAGATFALLGVSFSNGHYAYETTCFDVVYDTGEDIIAEICWNNSHGLSAGQISLRFRGFYEGPASTNTDKNVFVFKQEMFGMALATSLSYVAAVAVACTHFLRPVSSLRLIKPSGIFRELSAMIITSVRSLELLSATVLKLSLTQDQTEKIAIPFMPTHINIK